MPEVKGTIDVGRSVEDVFAYLTEPKNNVEWESTVVEMEMTSEGPFGVGSKGRRVEEFMGRDEGIWEITEYEENKMFAMKFESAKFIGDGGWQLESVEGGSRLAYRFQGNAKSSFMKLFILVMMPMFKRQIRKDYGTFKEILESKA